MDKWGKIVDTLAAQLPENERAEAMSVLAFFMEIARTLEDQAASLDRIATALEKRNHE